MTNPFHVVKDIFAEVRKTLSDGKSTDVSDYLQRLQRVFGESSGRRGSANGDLVGAVSQTGTIVRKFSKKFGSEFEKKFGKGGSKIAAMTKQTFSKLAKEFEDKVRQEKCDRECGNLKDFSPWLSAFHAEKIKCHLEIPGKMLMFVKPCPRFSCGRQHF